MHSFKRFLLEGGNVKVGDIQAQHIDLRKIPRKQLVNEILDSLWDLNLKFEKKYKIRIWIDPSILKECFSGSSEHFVKTDEISDEEFVQYKPQVGDIDVQVPSFLEKELTEFLKPGFKAGVLEYIGKSDTSIGQLSTLWHHTKRDIYIQIDFEFVEFTKEGLPTDWDRFAHSSSWEDIKKGIKGVFHKWLLGAVDYAFPKQIWLMKGKRNPKIERVMVHEHAFSVFKGLRKKYDFARDEKGNIIKYKGEPVYVEIPSKKASYTKDLSTIFKLLFRRDPQPGDLQKMKSFTGLVDLIRRYIKNYDQIKQIVYAFKDYCFSPRSQVLYRNDLLKDIKVKGIALQYLADELGVPIDVEKYAEEFKVSKENR